MKRLVLSVIALAFATACSESPCSLSFNYGIVVRVEDSVSGMPAASGALLILRDGAYAETAHAFSFDGLHLLGAGERPGLYRVTVRKPNYRDWLRVYVRLGYDGCHVKTVALTARLQPQ